MPKPYPPQFRRHALNLVASGRTVRDVAASLGIAEFTYCPTWTGMVYVAFVIDAYSRRILRWRAAGHMRASLVLDALEHAMWTRRQAGHPVQPGLVCHSDAGSQYVSLASTQRLAAAGALPSVGSVGDAFDSALAETTIGLFKTELFKPRGPWRTADHVEIAVLEWVDWYNHRRLNEHCGDIPPVNPRARPLPSPPQPRRGPADNTLSLRARRGDSGSVSRLTGARFGVASSAHPARFPGRRNT